jgi:hypothetical protein
VSARTDWKAMAHARGLDIPAPDLESVAQRLEALEEAVHPLALTLTPDQEPALSFRAQLENE